MKRAPCRSRGSEVATPPFDLPYTALILHMLTIYMRIGRHDHLIATVRKEVANKTYIRV